MRDEPQSFAEAVTEGHGACPTPQTHDRLEECHHSWHEMSAIYQEPNAFRWRLGAFLSAGRSVTLMLQSEENAFEDFAWYESWQDEARSDPLLGWLDEHRRLHTHRQSISPTSWLRVRCLVSVDDHRYVADDDIQEGWEGPMGFVPNPYLCTHCYIRSEPHADHPHEYTRFWEAADLPGQEILGICATLHDRLSALVEEAHHRLRHSLETKQPARASGSPRKQPRATTCHA